MVLNNMKVLVISPKNKTVFNFRGDLIKDMIRNGNEVFVTGPNQDFVDDIYQLGVAEFIEVPFVKDNTNIFSDYKYLKTLQEAIRKIKPDIVFGYNIKPVIYGSIAAKKEKVPHIFALVAGLGRTYNSNGIKAFVLKKGIKLLYKKAFSACEKVFFQNPNDIDELVKNRYLKRTKAVLVNGSGVNMNRFCRYPLPEKPVFLMVGRIIKEKGVLEYCEAARIVKTKYPEARCILLGGYDQSIGAIKPEDIQPYIDDGSIEFPGEVKDPLEYYKMSSVFVLPSYYHEGLPRTILEAMSCGRPIITTDWPGCREPVIDGVNGCLIPIKDSKILAEKMIGFIETPELVLQMGEASNEICKNRFDVKIINRDMLGVMLSNRVL